MYCRWTDFISLLPELIELDAVLSELKTVVLEIIVVVVGELVVIAAAEVVVVVVVVVELFGETNAIFLKVLVSKIIYRI